MSTACDTNRFSLQFGILHLIAWVTIWSIAFGLIQISLAGGNGWIIGYPRVVCFAGGLFFLGFGIAFPVARINQKLRWLVYTFVAFVVATCGFVFWYVESFKSVFIERGIADPDKITFTKLTFDPKRVLIIKYDVQDLPNCENTGFLVPWRDGFRSLSDEFLQRSS